MQTVRGTAEGALEAWPSGLHIRALQTAHKQFIHPGFLGAWEKATFLFYTPSYTQRAVSEYVFLKKTTETYATLKGKNDIHRGNYRYLRLNKGNTDFHSGEDWLHIKGVNVGNHSSSETEVGGRG